MKIVHLTLGWCKRDAWKGRHSSHSHLTKSRRKPWNWLTVMYYIPNRWLFNMVEQLKISRVLAKFVQSKWKKHQTIPLDTRLNWTNIRRSEDIRCRFFAKIDNRWKPLIVFGKCSIRRLLNVLCTVNSHPVLRGIMQYVFKIRKQASNVNIDVILVSLLTTSIPWPILRWFYIEKTKIFIFATSLLLFWYKDNIYVNILKTKIEKWTSPIFFWSARPKKC